MLSVITALIVWSYCFTSWKTYSIVQIFATALRLYLVCDNVFHALGLVRAPVCVCVFMFIVPMHCSISNKRHKRVHNLTPVPQCHAITSLHLNKSNHLNRCLNAWTFDTWHQQSPIIIFSVRFIYFDIFITVFASTFSDLKLRGKYGWFDWTILGNYCNCMHFWFRIIGIFVLLDRYIGRGWWIWSAMRYQWTYKLHQSSSIRVSIHILNE